MMDQHRREASRRSVAHPHGRRDRTRAANSTPQHGTAGPNHVARRLSLCAIAAAASALGGCSSVLMNPRGPVAADEKTILLNALAIMLVIVVPTILATLVFAWWFRASNT